MQSHFFPKDYILIWLLLVLMGLVCRPLMPIDETRAVSVAWEMWRRGDFLVPHLNGLPYSHKPPLLQWCIHFFWSLLGVQEWNARLVAPLFALGNLVMTVKLSRLLWPDDMTCPRMVPLILLALPVWALWSTLTLYDMLATFFTLLSLYGICLASQGKTYKGWVLAALAIGGGILAKGPALLLMSLPTALFAPWWMRAKPQTGWMVWYANLLRALLMGGVIALIWAIPAGFAGGEDYQKAILWVQTVGRISHSFAHSRPFWWYFVMLPFAFLPWIAWPALWRSARAMVMDSGVRFCATQSLSALLLFSLVSAKQLHYLLPIFPSLALIAARTLSLSNFRVGRKDQIPFLLLIAIVVALFFWLPSAGLMMTIGEAADITGKTPWPLIISILGFVVAILLWRPFTPLASVRAVAFSVLGLMLIAHLVFLQVGWPYYSMQAFADKLAELENQGIPIAHWKKYHGEFNFLGHLSYPLVEIDDKQVLLSWIGTHNQGVVVIIGQANALADEEGAVFAQLYRGSRRIMLWKCDYLTSRPDIIQRIFE